MNDEIQQDEAVTATETEATLRESQDTSDSGGGAPEHMPTIPQLAVALSILVLAMSSSYLSRFIIPDSPTESAALEQAPAVIEQVETVFEDPFERVSIHGEAAYVWDVARQRALFKKNASAQLPLASLTKLMTAIVFEESVDIDTAEVAITLDAIRQEGEYGFNDGDTWSARRLLDYTLVTSSNDGAYALAAAAGASIGQSDNPAETFIDAMNKKAEALGLSQTYFTNATGLDANEAKSGSYGSARDMAFLMEYIVRERSDLLSKTAEPVLELENTSGARYTATNTNRSVRSYPNLLGSKTGYTDLAGGNLVIAFDAGLNRPIIISVLHSTAEGRFEDVAALAAAAQEYVMNEPTLR